MDNLIEDVLSGDPERKTSVIASIFNFHESEPGNIPELLYKMRYLLRNYESSSRGEALSFLKELFVGFPADEINEKCRDFILVQTLHAFVDENCSIRDMKHALQLLDTVANRLHIKKLMSNEEDSMQNFGSKLPGIGDFEVQSLLLKLLCKVADYGDEKFWSSVWFNKDIGKEFLKTVFVNNPSHCRRFLNLVNRLEEHKQVFSFVAQTVSSNSVQLRKPLNVGDFWIDLNFDSRSISFCCEEFNDNNQKPVCIQAQSVEKYSLKTQVAAQIQELCITLNSPFSDFLQEDVPDLDTSNLLVIRFWKFLSVKNYLKKIFGSPFNEVDAISDNHSNRKVSQSEYFHSSDPQSYAATKTDRKVSRSSEFISVSLPIASMETIKTQRKVSNSFDAIPYDSNVVPTETQRSTQRKMSCSSGIIPISDNEVPTETQRSTQRKMSCSSGIIPIIDNEVPTETQRSTQRKMSSSGIIPISDNEDEGCYEPTPVHSNENHRRRTPSTSKTNSNTSHSKDSNGSVQQKHVTLEYTKAKVIQLPISPAESEKAASDSKSKHAKLSRTKKMQEKPCNTLNTEGIKVGQSHNGYSEPVSETKLVKNNCKKQPRNMYNLRKHSRGKGLEQNSNKKSYSHRHKKLRASGSNPVVVEDSLDVYSDEILSVILEETVTQVVEEAYSSPVSVSNSKETRLAKSSLSAISKQNGSISQQKVPRSRRERTLSADNVPEQVQQSSSFHSIETLHSPENKKLKSVTDNHEIDRDHYRLCKTPHILIVKENVLIGANESSKEFQEDGNRQDADVHVMQDNEPCPISTAIVRQADKPASPENSETEKLSQSKDDALSQSKTKKDSRVFKMDELVSKDSYTNHEVPSSPGTNRERRYAIKSFASSRKNAKHPHLQAHHDNPKSPVDVLVLSDKQSSAEEEPVQGSGEEQVQGVDSEPHPSPKHFRKERHLNKESRSVKMRKTASKRSFQSTQRRIKLFDADRSSPVHLSENTSSNRYKSKRTLLPMKPVPEKVTSAHKDSSSESDFRPLNWKRSKKTGRSKTVSNDSGFREQSSASKSLSSSQKTKKVPPLSEDKPDENISHGDNLGAETPHSIVCSPLHNDQDSRLSNCINEFTDNQVGNSPKPHTPIPDWNEIQYSLGFCKDPNGAKLSRTVSQPLEEETESVREKKLNESLKIIKTRSNSSSSGSVYRRQQRNSVKPKKVLKKLFISDTETESSGLSWTKSKQVRLFQSPKKTFYKRKTVASALKLKSPLRFQPKRSHPSSKTKAFKAKRNSSKRNTSERLSNSSPDPYSVFDEPEYSVEGHKKPQSARQSALSTTPHQRLPSISEDEQSFDAAHNDLTLIPGNSVSERMETPSNSHLSDSKKGRHVHKPHILKVQPRKSPTENDSAFNNSRKKTVEHRQESDDNFVDLPSGPDEVFEEPPSRQRSTRLSKNIRATNASVSESSVIHNSSERKDSRLDEKRKISPYKTICASGSLDLQDIPVADECSPPKTRNTSANSNLRKDNVRSFSEEMIDRNDKVDQYLQSLSDASDEKDKPDCDSFKAESIGDKSDSNLLENEVEQNVDIDLITSRDNPSNTERASPMEILDNEGSLNKKKELLRRSNLPKEVLGKKRKFEEKNDSNLATVKNIGSSKGLAGEVRTLKKSSERYESKEQKNLRKEAMMKNTQELSNITSTKKRKYKDFVDLEEIKFLGKAHRQMEESNIREAEEIIEMKKSKTIKSQKDKQEKEIDTSTSVPNWGSNKNSTYIYESATLTMSPILKKRFKKYKTSTPKPGRDLMYLNQKHYSSILSLQESLDKLSFTLLRTLKKYHKRFIMETAFSRNSMVRYINTLLEESECSENNLEYLLDSIQERRNHISNSAIKIFQMAREYFEKEEKWSRKFGNIQNKVIGKYTVEVHEVEKSAVDSVMKRMLTDTKNKLNSLLNDFKYY